jgi:hypothetical protein
MSEGRELTQMQRCSRLSQIQQDFLKRPAKEASEVMQYGDKIKYMSREIFSQCYRQEFQELLKTSTAHLLPHTSY